MLGISALEPVLSMLHGLRRQLFLRPEETIDRLAALGRFDEAIEATQSQIVRSPGNVRLWELLGRIAYDRTQQAAEGDEAGAVHGAGVAYRKPSQPPLEEDKELQDVIDRPPAVDLARIASIPEREVVRGLRNAAAALMAENALLATKSERLRRQLGYRVDALEPWVKYEHTKYYMRALSLFMHRYGVTEVPTAPREVPAVLTEGFSMRGRVPIESGYLNAAYPEIWRDIYSDFDIEAYKRVWRGEQPSDAGERQAAMSFGMILGETDAALQRAVRARLGPGMRAAVVGSRGPIYEALCADCGALPTTIRRTAVMNRTANIETLTFAECEAMASRFDAAIAVSVVEQAGLGMHGEPIEPNGDLDLMGRLKRWIKPGGLLFLVLPTGDDRTIFNANRIYGELRLPRVLERWQVVERQRNRETLDHGAAEGRTLFVLANAP